MDIDPALVEMLATTRAALEALGRPMTLDETRTSYRERYRARGSQYDGPLDAELVPVGDGATLHVFRPAGDGTAGHADGDRLRPGILYLHGGGFAYGDAEAFAAQSQTIADRLGAVVAFLDYRLAPEHRFPAAHDDALAAAALLARSAGDLGIDPRRLALMGDSAGGNLAIATALGTGAGTGPGIRWRALCALYPWVDPRPYLGIAGHSASDRQFAERSGLDLSVMTWFAEQVTTSPADAADPRLTPLLSPDLERLPPTLVFGAENDVLRDQGARFAAAVSAAGALREYRVFARVIHNFAGHVHVSEPSRDAFDEVLRSFGAAL